MNLLRMQISRKQANYGGRFICIYPTYEISGMSMDPIRTGFPRTCQILWVLKNKVVLPIKRKVFRILPRGISHLRDTEPED